MKTYYARIPRTGWFVRVPRWFYNRWPWCGVVQMPNNHSAQTRSPIADAPPSGGSGPAKGL